MSVGLAYDAWVWRTAWPKTMTDLVEACAATSARIVLWLKRSFTSGLAIAIFCTGR